MTSDEESSSSGRADSNKRTETIQKEIERNEQKEYTVQFDWGPDGEVEVRSVK